MRAPTGAVRARARTFGPAGMENSPPSAVPTPADASHLTFPHRLALSYGEAARAAGLSARTIWAEVAKGDLRAARIGRRRLIPRDELVRWLNAKAGIVASVQPGKGGAR